ncbi:MAG: amino acid racemase [Chloroflexota bacterium]
MKKIGIVGGMAPESTIEYYRTITRLGPRKGKEYFYPEVLVYSLNFEEMVGLLAARDLSGLAHLLVGAIRSLHRAGAEFALLASNTPHVVFDDVAASSPVPLLSIVEETGRVAKGLGYSRVGLFGTNFTMKAGFYNRVLSTRYGIAVVTPEEPEQDYIHHKIMSELVSGVIVEETRQGLCSLARVMAKEKEIQALILGCTELPMVMTQDSIGIPVLDTARIHAEAAFYFAMSDGLQSYGI